VDRSFIMLSHIWVRVRVAIGSAVRIGISLEKSGENRFYLNLKGNG
jgi:hypothetical protein